MNKKRFMEEMKLGVDADVVAVLIAAGVIVVGSLISLVTFGFHNKLQWIGMGLLCISLGVLFVFEIVKLFQLCVQCIAWLFSHKRKVGGK